MGQRTTKTFAIDPTTGTVLWVQSPERAAGGFTTSQTIGSSTGGGGTNGPPPNSHTKQSSSSSSSPPPRQRTKPVLLQREDYTVRAVDIESGMEYWSVGMGKFSTIDFQTSNRARTNAGGGSGSGGGRGGGRGGRGGNHRSSSHGTSSNNEQQRERDERYPTSIRPRVPSLTLRSSSSSSSSMDGKTSAAVSSSTSRRIESNNPLLARRTKPRNGGRPFPYVRSGKDGRSIVAVDHRTGVELWKRGIESHIASVFGVGSENQWVSLDVEEEEEDLGSDACGGGGGGGG